MIRRVCVALAKAPDRTVLKKATGADSEAYLRVSWDASACLGQDLKIKALDQAIGRWGRLTMSAPRRPSTASSSPTSTAPSPDRCRDEADLGAQRRPITLDGDILALNVFLDKSIDRGLGHARKSITTRVYPAAMTPRAWPCGPTAARPSNLSSSGRCSPPTPTNRSRGARVPLARRNGKSHRARRTNR
jgi:hypothetical protein